MQSGAGLCKPIALSNATAAHLAPGDTEATTCGAAAAATAKIVAAKPVAAKLSAKQAAKVAKAAGGASGTAKPNSSKSAKPVVAATKQPVKQQQQQQAKQQCQQMAAAADPARLQPQERACQAALQIASKVAGGKSIAAKQPDSRATTGKAEPSGRLLHQQAAKRRSASPTDAATTNGPAAGVGISFAAAQTAAAAAGNIHTATTSSAQCKAAAAAAKGPLRAPRFNPYIPGSRQHRQVSQSLHNSQQKGSTELCDVAMLSQLW